MTTVTISTGLDKGRVRILPDGGDNLAQLIAHLAEVHAVHNFTRHVVAFGAINDVLERSRALYRCSHGEEVVFANENDRELEESREIQRLVKATLVDRAIAEKAKCNPVFLLIFRGDRHPAGEGHRGTA